ncbi:MAG: CHAT domain-containing protein [Nostoc sp. NMS1]|uniref:NB-ARC domain-containing protein n=1 Tax=Nostoc sp. NMS1 TaxID=2815388 RepID=UPI0025F26D2C|nr:NB-ARC domain-containing protein [Nostoc sp. NMS1]MBN3906564.1 CHAT domain-containing protein [Nostoc sp. NMS1]
MVGQIIKDLLKHIDRLIYLLLMNQDKQLKSILFLAANPKGTANLRLQEEEREIKERLRLAGYGKVPINSTGATRPRDIQQAMLDFKPQIVHFSGHGTGRNGLVFEDITGQEKLVTSKALADLFKLFTKSIECVVLNACYSKFQAEAIAQHVAYVIGMNQSINDRAAIDFSVGFYTALGAGESFKFAYQLGCNAIQLEGITEYLIPVLFENGQLVSNQNNLDINEEQGNPSSIQFDILSTEEDKNNKNFAEIIRDNKFIDKTYSILFGRQKEIEILIGIIKNPQSKRILSICGLGGIGKTSLATEIAERCYQEKLFEEFIWETAKQEIFLGAKSSISQPSFINGFSLLENLAKKLNIRMDKNLERDDQKKYLKNKIREQLALRRYFILVDNLETAEDYREVVQDLSEIVNSHTKVVITSRNQLSEFDTVYSISLDGLIEEGSISFLQAEGRDRGVNAVAEANVKSLREIHRVTGGAPLALKFVVSLLTRLSLEVVLSNLKKAEGQTEQLYNFLYYNIWKLLSSDSRKVIVSMAVLPASVTRSAIQKVSMIPENILADAISELVFMSLLNPSHALLDSKKRYSIHALTSNFIRTELIKKWS